MRRNLGHKKGKGKKKDKDKDPLIADIETLDEDDYLDLTGWVTLEYNDDDEMIMDYHIKEGPERCDKCKLAIHDGYSCDDLDDDTFHDMENDPWSMEDTPYLTNKKNRAAGFFKTDNGYGYGSNECKFVVLYDEEEDEEEDDGYDDDYKYRMLKHKKKDDGPKKIGCGQLIPEGQTSDYC